MKYALFQSVVDMTRPEALSELLRQPITTTRLVPFVTAGWSATGTTFTGVHVNEEPLPRLVIKRIAPERDWVMRNTDDVRCRSVAAWQHGILDRMPPEIDTTVIACATDGTGSAILMVNVTDSLLPDGPQISVRDNSAIVDAMAALHAAFWEDSTLKDPALGLCSLASFITHSGPEKCRRLANRLPNTEVLDMMINGWELVPSFFEPEAAKVLLAFVRDPSRLTIALDAYPKTLLHGDPRIANIGIVSVDPPKVILLDMARLMFEAPAVDLGYYLAASFGSLPVPADDVIYLYTQRLAQRLGTRFDEERWQPQLDLCLLAGSLPLMCFKSWFASRLDKEGDRVRAKAEFQWWSQKIRRAAKHL